MIYQSLMSMLLLPSLGPTVCPKGDVRLFLLTINQDPWFNQSFPDYDARQDPNAPGNLIILRGEPHVHRRRLWNRGLTPEALSEYETIIAKRASQVVSRIQESRGTIDFVSYVNYFT